MVPSDLLRGWIDHVPHGYALDVGAGEGEVSIWLARQGFKVDGIEQDPEVCKRLREACKELDINIHRVSIMDFVFIEVRYSLVHAGAVLHFLKPTDLWVVADKMVSSMVPGGFLVAEVFTTDDPGYDELRNSRAEEIEPNTFVSSTFDDPIHYFESGELARTCASLEIKDYEEARFLDPKDPEGYRAGASIVARRG
jgi:SAM-dependent methyltransferase